MTINPSSQPEISVVIPTFNRPAATRRAARSALCQSYPPLEVIVVDDGSLKPISRDEIGIDDPRLRILHLDRNRGPGAARQAGVNSATGNFVAFLDSDDEWLPHKLAAQVGCLQGSAPIAVACGWTAVREDGRPPKSVIPRESRNSLDFAAGCWFAPGSTLLVSRSMFDLVGPFNSQLRRLEDYEWFLRFALAGGRLVVKREVAAIVSVGGRGRLETVGHAKAIIEETIESLQHSLVDSRFRRIATAYLSLEMAKAAQNEGRPILMAQHMLRSLALVPRIQPALRQWWTINDHSST
ncbi:glycosyltransferase family 2 protein [Rhodopseudomonas parapalustris]